MLWRRRQLIAGRVMLGGVLAAMIGLWTLPAAGQTSSVTTPSGTTVSTGVIRDDPAADAEAERKRRKKRFAEMIAKAREHVGAGEWLLARQRLDDARHNVTSKATDLPPLRELYQAVEAQGQAMLAEANQAFLAESYGVALAGYSEVAKIFKGLPSGDQAADALAAARKDERVTMYLADQAAQGLAGRIDAVIAAHLALVAGDEAVEDEQDAEELSRVDAIRALPIDKQVAVVDEMESIVNQFSATPTGVRVRGELAELEADEALMARISAARQARKADQALKRAQMYQKGGMLEKALDYYKAVVADYPDSDAAKTARQAIKEIAGQPSR